MRLDPDTLIRVSENIDCDVCHLVGRSPQTVQAKTKPPALFQAVAAVHSSEAPAASMIASMIRRNASGARCSTKRLAMKAPTISDDPAIRPLSATSGVSAPNRSKVMDFER